MLFPHWPSDVFILTYFFFLSGTIAQVGLKASVVLNRYDPYRFMCLNAWPQGLALLGGVALLEEVCHYTQWHSLLFSMNQDVELSAPSPAPCLPGCCHVSHHDDNGLNRAGAMALVRSTDCSSQDQIPATTWWLTTIRDEIWCPLLGCLKTATVYLYIIKK